MYVGDAVGGWVLVAFDANFDIGSLKVLKL